MIMFFSSTQLDLSKVGEIYKIRMCQGSDLSPGVWTVQQVRTHTHIFIDIFSLEVLHHFILYLCLYHVQKHCFI